MMEKGQREESHRESESLKRARKQKSKRFYLWELSLGFSGGQACCFPMPFGLRKGVFWFVVATPFLVSLAMGECHDGFWFVFFLFFGFLFLQVLAMIL